jgi:hypothetical protein
VVGVVALALALEVAVVEEEVLDEPPQAASARLASARRSTAITGLLLLLWM